MEPEYEAGDLEQETKRTARGEEREEEEEEEEEEVYSGANT